MWQTARARRWQSLVGRGLMAVAASAGSPKADATAGRDAPPAPPGARRVSRAPDLRRLVDEIQEIRGELRELRRAVEALAGGVGAGP